MIALIFVLINLALSYLARVLDRRLSRSRPAGTKLDVNKVALPMETAQGAGI